MTRVACMGEALGVLLPTERGSVGYRSTLSLRAAGAEMNVAIGLKRLGIPVEYWGAVGSDAAGRVIRTTLMAEGVNVDGLETREAPTGFLLREWLLGDEPDVHYYRNASPMRHWQPSDVAMQKMLACDWLHVSGITWMLTPSLADSAEHLTGLMGNGGRMASLDLNVRRKLAPLEEWRRVMARAVPKASVIFASTADLASLWDVSGADQLNRLGVMGQDQVWVIKEGTRRSAAYRQNECLGVADTYPVSRVVDVVGAGDGFAAGVIGGRTKGLDWAESLRIGNIVGAFAVSSMGDWDGYPDWERVQQFILGSHHDR